jgi:AAA15 family ATPase/GTPase
MLLRFSVENWMSFRDEATLDLVATREEQHSNHTAPIAKYGLKLLPVAAIYGANASGKSNLIKALSFAQQFITNPPKAHAPISVKPFLLSKGSSEHPTSFRFELLIGKIIYEYKFSVTTTRVTHEELKRVNAASDDTLFQRGTETSEFILSEDIREREEQNFAFRGTRDNQLYLTNSVSQRLEEFKPLFDWFEKSLIVILPYTRFGQLSDITDVHHPHFTRMKTRLHDLDSGIASFRRVNISSEGTLPKELFDTITANLKEGDTLPLSTPWEEGVFLCKEDGRIVARRLSPIHRGESGEEILFNLSDESDGTRRLLDLLPAFLFLEESKTPPVFVIDELDRSLHSNLTRSLIEHYLGQRTDASQSQLIFTTHDTQLMTQDIFRRDEIWVTERDQFGASKLVAFSEFKDVRKDKDIRKSYLQGRLGGIPKIRSTIVACEDEAAVR